MSLWHIFITIYSLMSFTFQANIEDSNMNNLNNVSPLTYYYKLDSKLIDVFWCGENQQVYFLLTEANSVYKIEERGNSTNFITINSQLKMFNDIKADEVL